MREKSWRWLQLVMDHLLRCRPARNHAELVDTTAAGALITNQKAPPCALLVASKRTRDWLPYSLPKEPISTLNHLTSVDIF